LWNTDGVPLARTTDPLSSHVAAADVVSSGRARAHRELLLELIAAHPARTGRGLAELAQAVGHRDLDVAAVSKRLPELLRDELVEAVGGIDGRPRRWFIAKGKP
jgi:hypothetical protein